MQFDPFFTPQPQQQQQTTDILPTNGEITWKNVILTAAKNRILWHRFVEWW